MAMVKSEDLSTTEMQQIMQRERDRARNGGYSIEQITINFGKAGEQVCLPPECISFFNGRFVIMDLEGKSVYVAASCINAISFSYGERAAGHEQNSKHTLADFFSIPFYRKSKERTTF